MTDIKDKKMTDDELFECVKNKKTLCCYCGDLKQQVLDRGVIAIDEYDGMICGCVEDIFIKRGRW